MKIIFVALIADTGSVLERYRYDAYGTCEVQTAGFAARTTSSYDWEYSFTTRRLDAETGCMYYRNRYYHPTLGRFQKRDPIGYEGGDANLHCYASSNPALHTDATGLFNEGIADVHGWVNKHWGVGSFFDHYYFGLGKTIDLGDVGLLEMLKSQAQDQLKHEMKRIQDKVVLDCNKQQQSFSDRENFNLSMGGGILDPMTVLGNTGETMTYDCVATVECMCCKGNYTPIKHSGYCDVSFDLRDRFANPLDWGGQFYERNQIQYDQCVMNCDWSYWYFPPLAYKCRRDCSIKYPRSEWWGAHPYDITASWKQEYSWETFLEGDCE